MIKTRYPLITSVIYLEAQKIEEFGIESFLRLPMLLISVQEVSKQLAWEARGAVTKSGGDEILKGIEALLRHDMFFYSDDGSSSSAEG